MIRTPVTSSSIREIGYDPGTRQLEVKFASGQVYRYADVPPEQHALLIGADSIGRQMSAIRSGGFAFTKLDPDEAPADPAEGT